MHLPSAAEIKHQTNKNKVGRVKQDKPKEGTLLRDLYDRFADNPGKLIPLMPEFWNSGCFTQLRDYYGLEIRKVRNPGRRGHPSYYYLCKFWNGKDYTDLTPLLNKDTPILGQD